MHHPVLGELNPEDESGDSFSGQTKLADRVIPFKIERDEDQIEDTLEFALEIIQSLGKFDALAKKIVTRDLLNSYNSGWNEYDIRKKDGSLETIKNPGLDAREFERHFTLDSISICGKDCVDCWYGECDLFWGHCVYVTTLNGTDFSNAQAQLFG